MAPRSEVQTKIFTNSETASFHLPKTQIFSPLLNTVFRGHFMCPGGSLLKKGGANENIGLDR